MDKETLNFGIAFGALSEPIAEQLKQQGLRADRPEDIELWQKDADAITRLAVRGLLSPSEAERTRKRLLKAIGKGIVVAPRKGQA